MLSRRLLPWITVVMPIIGWLRLEGERHGLFGRPLGTAIMVLAGGLLVTAIARLAAVSMDRQATALNHAWHQYGLVSAGQVAGRAADQGAGRRAGQTGGPDTGTEPDPSPDARVVIAFESEADRRQIWLDI